MAFAVNHSILLIRQLDLYRIPSLHHYCRARLILAFSPGIPFFDLLRHLAGQKLGSHLSAYLGSPGPSTVVLALAFGVRLISDQNVAIDSTDPFTDICLPGRDLHHLAAGIADCHLGYYFGIVLWDRLC